MACSGAVSAGSSSAASSTPLPSSSSVPPNAKELEEDEVDANFAVISCRRCLNNDQKQKPLMRASEFKEHFAWQHLGGFCVYECPPCGRRFATELYAFHHIACRCPTATKETIPMLVPGLDIRIVRNTQLLLEKEVNIHLSQSLRKMGELWQKSVRRQFERDQKRKQKERGMTDKGVATDAVTTSESACMTSLDERIPTASASSSISTESETNTSSHQEKQQKKSNGLSPMHIDKRPLIIKREVVEGDGEQRLHISESVSGDSIDNNHAVADYPTAGAKRVQCSGGYNTSEVHHDDDNDDEEEKKKEAAPVQSVSRTVKVDQGRLLIKTEPFSPVSEDSGVDISAPLAPDQHQGESAAAEVVRHATASASTRKRIRVPKERDGADEDEPRARCHKKENIIPSAARPKSSAGAEGEGDNVLGNIDDLEDLEQVDEYLDDDNAAQVETHCHELEHGHYEDNNHDYNYVNNMMQWPEQYYDHSSAYYDPTYYDHNSSNNYQQPLQYDYEPEGHSLHEKPDHIAPPIREARAPNYGRPGPGWRSDLTPAATQPHRSPIKKSQRRRSNQSTRRGDRNSGSGRNSGSNRNRPEPQVESYSGGINSA